MISPPATPSADAIVPADWLTYRDPEGRFTVRYPPLWFAERGGFSTFKLGSVGPRFPEEAIKIDVGYTPESQLGGCTKDPQATQVQIAGETAWLVVKNYQDPVVTRSYQAWVPYHGYCYAMLALFSQRQPDDELFMKFVNSFRFGK